MMQFKFDASDLIEKSNLNFDDLLEQTWTDAERNGVLKFKFSESVRKRSLDGNYRFYCYLNSNRLTMKRKAQVMDKIKVSMNHDEFNFTKIKEDEKLFDFVIKGIESTVDQHATNDQCNGHRDERRIKGTIIVNNAPIEHCSSLLVVELDRCLPQVYYKESLLLALYVASVSKSEYLRLGFNSAGANSSVNHCHWHLYYQKEDLLIARLPINNNQLQNWFLRSLVFELDTTLNKPEIYLNLATNVEMLLNYITDRLKLAYNLFITKCSTNTNIVRLFIWPRLPHFGSKDGTQIRPALSEFSGFFTCKQEDTFNNLTEEELIKLSKQYELSEHLFNEITGVKETIFKSDTRN